MPSSNVYPGIFLRDANGVEKVGPRRNRQAPNYGHIRKLRKGVDEASSVVVYKTKYFLEWISAMALSLKDPETDRLAREVSKLTGESLTQAVRTALAERLDREKRRRGRGKSLAEELDALGKECAALPELDSRSADEIIGYDENGMWH
jgi:antitoxin VapB